MFGCKLNSFLSFKSTDSHSGASTTCLFMRNCTNRQVPVDVWDFGVDVEAENQEENSRHHGRTAADKLKKVDPSTWSTHHDGFYADETNDRQDLETEKAKN